MFFRVKKIKGKEYVYLVENEWKKGTSRQKVKGYIGRAFRFEPKKQIDFADFLKSKSIDMGLEEFAKNASNNKIINMLIEWESAKQEIPADFSIDLKEGSIRINGKDAAISINNGFLCGRTLKSLLDFKPIGDEEHDGKRLARAFIEAGINVPHEVFAGIFGKYYKDEQNG